MAYLRQVTQALHQIAEKLAEKEIQIDPKNFVSRETISRNIRMNLSSSGREKSNEMYYSFIDGSMGDPTDTASFGDDVRSRNVNYRVSNSEECVK